MDGGQRTISKRKPFIAICFLGLVVAAQGSNGKKQFEPQFTGAEKSSIAQFWGEAGRYSVGEPVNTTTRGKWQVRLTPQGSLWLWNLSKGHKTATSLTYAPLSESGTAQGSSEQWIVRKIRHDRWKALMDARTANSTSGPTLLPPSDKETPELEPAIPGPMPDELWKVSGEAPVFAAAVQPRRFTVNFDDGAIEYEDNVRLSSPRYAYYRFSQGVMSGGVPVRKVEPERLQRVLALAGCDDSSARVLRSVSQLEGGFDAVNTYDTGYVSVGFIQFASLKDGAGSLGAMLLQYKSIDPTDFNEDFHRFGVDVQPSGLLDVVDPVTGEEVSGSEANSRIIQDKRLIAVFQRAGQKSDAFCAAQIRTALNAYYPVEDKLSITTPEGLILSGKVGELIRSEAGRATLFDRKVNTGTIAILNRVSGQIAAAHHCQSLLDLSKYEKEIVCAVKYRSDFTRDQTLSQPAERR